MGGFESGPQMAQISPIQKGWSGWRISPGFVASFEVSELGPQMMPISPIEIPLRHLENLWMTIQVIRETAAPHCK
jgi:hypothetical protein